MMLNKDKNIGKVLFIVEGLKTEFYLLHKIFTQIFDYEYEKYDRMDKYKKYNKKENIDSSIFVINTEESAIKYVDDSNEYLNNIFSKLIDDYHFPVDRAAIYYIFDRDVRSNVDSSLIKNLMQGLNSSRDSNGFNRQGLLVLSYPAIESYVASNFITDSIQLQFETGEELKLYLDQNKIIQNKISDETICMATIEMEKSLKYIGICDYDLDSFGTANLKIFNFQEKNYEESGKFKLLSLLSIVLLDLGLVEIDG